MNNAQIRGETKKKVERREKKKKVDRICKIIIRETRCQGNSGRAQEEGKKDNRS